MKATIYTGLTYGWCTRVKQLLKANGYSTEEIMVNNTILTELRTKYDKAIHVLPQVVIRGALVGGFKEVTTMLNHNNQLNQQ